MRRLHLLSLAVCAGCLVGPAYHRPPAPTPRAARFKEQGTWKTARPSDVIPRGAWWTMFRAAELDALQARLDVSNQTIASVAENYLAARAQVRVAEAQYFPTATLVPSYQRGRSPGVAGANTTALTGSQIPVGGGGITGPFTGYVLLGEASWIPDLFGRVRYEVRQNRYTAQAAAADLENARLAVQAMLAATYFRLRGQDALQEVLDATVRTNEEILALTQQRMDAGLENEATLLQAQQTLESARVQATNTAALRAEYEHAIATLLGRPATTFSLPHRALIATPPPIPTGIPTALLERRPDIAGAERRMAAANAAVGIGYTAYYPTLTLTGALGLASSTLSNLFHWSSRLWAIGVRPSETLFDGGARHARIRVLVAQYNATVADYRQTVLVAFQQVEDSLSTMRVLGQSIEQQRNVVSLSERGLELERLRYERGLDPYIELMTRQNAVLAARQQLVTLEVQRMVAAVQLVQALGGGWDRADLPED